MTERADLSPVFLAPNFETTAVPEQRGRKPHPQGEGQIARTARWFTERNLADSQMLFDRLLETRGQTPITQVTLPWELTPEEDAAANRVAIGYQEFARGQQDFTSW